jgi:hypothetical protein
MQLALKEYEETLVEGTLAKALRTTGAAPANATSFRVNEQDVTVGFTKL